MHEDADESSILGGGVLPSGWGRALVFGAARERKFVPLANLWESPLPLRLLSFFFFGLLWVGGSAEQPPGYSSNYLKRDVCYSAPFPVGHRATPRP